MSSPTPLKRVMPMSRLGKTGLIVSRLSFGSWVTFQNQLDGASWGWFFFEHFVREKGVSKHEQWRLREWPHCSRRLLVPGA